MFKYSIINPGEKRILKHGDENLVFVELFLGLCEGSEKRIPKHGDENNTKFPVSIGNEDDVKKESPNMGTKGRLV